MPHTRPAKGQDVVCSTCIEPNKNKKTVGFKDPIAAYVGRYVDSVNTRNVQNVGIRTIRAQRIRVSEARQRILVEYGEAVAAFPIATFLVNVKADPLAKPGVMKTGGTVSRLGDPIEGIARPSTFFYAETRNGGWVFKPQDTQETLTDFDLDDRGNVYVGTFSWGWGIVRDENEFPDTRPMTLLEQVSDAPVIPNSVFTFKSNRVQYAIVSASGVVSASAPSLLIYNANKPSAPVLEETRKGKENGIVAWARNDARKRLAVINSDKKLRIFKFDAFISGAAPLVTLTPARNKTFRDMSFDENGTLWILESGSSPATGNKLWQLDPTTSGTKTPIAHDVYGSSFAPERIAARKGYVAVGGKAPNSKTELRLYRLNARRVPVFVDTGNFFYRYYHDKTPPAGFASASTYNPAYTSLYALHLLENGGKLYLLYSANGLGDVYQLQ
jgi:hypothetical protein